MGNQYSDYKDEYEEPGYKLEERWFWKYNQPRRYRKNPVSPPCTNLDSCKSIEDYYEYRDWVAKEWAVYIQEINLFKDDIKLCLRNDQMRDSGRVCGSLFTHYFSLISVQNLAEAKKHVKRGNRLVDESGYVYKYHETTQGFEENLKALYDTYKMKNSEEFLKDRLEKTRRFPYQ